MYFKKFIANKALQYQLFIEYAQPKVFIIEYPATGMMKNRSVMQHMEQYLRRVTYCMYNLPYEKETAFLTKLNDFWKPRRLCTHANPCPQVVDFWHPASAQNRDRFSQKRFKKEELYVIPAELCRELAIAAQRFCDELPPVD